MCRLRSCGDWVVACLRARSFEPGRAGRSVALPASIQVTDDLLWFLGLWVAEGSSHRREGNAFITISCDDDRLDRATAVIESVFGLHVVRVPGSAARGPAIFVHSSLLARRAGSSRDSNRNASRSPAGSSACRSRRLKWFIEGYREGDGVHSGKKFDEGVRHEFSTIHAALKDDLVVALRPVRAGLRQSGAT